ncbi:MAG TPA: response regulator, partial [Tepidisphaeraceae bacterium]
ALEPLGVEIQEAHNSVAALVMINRAPPDLVILDVNMPSGSGLSVCEMLSSDARLAHLPVVILTSESDDRTRLRCQSMRAHYIEKNSDAIEQVKHFAAQTLSLESSEPCSSQLFTG